MMKNITCHRFEALVTKLWDEKYGVQNFLVIGPKGKTPGNGEVYFVPPNSALFIYDIFPRLLKVSRDYDDITQNKETFDKFLRNSEVGYLRKGYRIFFQLLPGPNLKIWAQRPNTSNEPFFQMPPGQLYPPFNTMPSGDWGCGLWHGWTSIRNFYACYVKEGLKVRVNGHPHIIWNASLAPTTTSVKGNPGKSACKIVFLNP